MNWASLKPRVKSLIVGLLSGLYGLTTSVVSGVIVWVLNGIMRVADGTVSAPAYAYLNEVGTGLYRYGSQTIGVTINGFLQGGWGGKDATIGASGPWLTSTNTMGWISNSGSGTMDTHLWRDAADTIAQRRGAANVQTFRLYAAFTDSSNYERLSIATASGTMTIAAETAGSGTDNISIAINPVGTGGLTTTGKWTNYAGVAAAGWGVPAIYGSGQATAQTARSAALATYTVGAADGSFEVSANVLVTTSTTHSFSVDVEYTDEGNTARTMILPMTSLAGTFITGGLITNVTGAGPYVSPALHIRAKAATAITIRPSAGTFTTVTYNAEGSIKQVA